MADSSLLLGEPMVVPRTARYSGKALVLLSLLIGLFLAALVIMGGGMTTSASSQLAESTNLIGMPTLRSGKPNTMLPPMMGNLRDLPGGKWKELALAGIEAANRCDRDPSVSANRLRSMMANMNSEDRAIIARAESSVVSKMEDLKAGQTAPMGFFDPLKLSAGLSTGRILFYREAELKHGRVCMLASLGFLVGENFHPLFGGNIDVPSYVAFQATPLQSFWILVSLAVAIPEVIYAVPTFEEPSTGYQSGDTFAIKSDRVPGDLGWDPLGLKPKDEKALLNMQNRELNNGRLAMFAIAGMVGQQLVDGQKILPVHGGMVR